MNLMTADKVKDFFTCGAPVKLDDEVAPRFKEGDDVVGKTVKVSPHCRLPRYVRGKKGKIVKDVGVYIFADTNAINRDPKPQHMYTVRFMHKELWGEAASDVDSVVLTLWDDHMDHA